MAKTFLYNNHLKLGAKMTDFAGWELPVQYTGIIKEHNNVRNNAGLFDVSHMGEIFISGKDSLDYLQMLVPQDISELSDGKALYCQLTNERAGIIDDLIIYKLENNSYLAVVNASRVEVDYKWFTVHAKNFDVQTENKSDMYSMVALQGPKAADILEEAGIKKSVQPETFHIIKAKLSDNEVFISRTGYTGEDGFEIITANDKISDLWEMLLEKGQKFGILPAGLGARDTLRLEAAMSLYGHELTEDTTPIEAGLAWSVDKNKKEYYIGKDIILEQLKNGTDKKLTAFRMLECAVARNSYKIYSGCEEIGVVTSGCISPSTGRNIGLGYIKTGKNLKINDTIQIMIRNRLCNAVITEKNFIKKHNRGN